MPNIIESHKAQIKIISKEIERLRALQPTVEEELAALIAKHPEYPGLLPEIIARMTAKDA